MFNFLALLGFIVQAIMVIFSLGICIAPFFPSQNALIFILDLNFNRSRKFLNKKLFFVIFIFNIKLLFNFLVTIYVFIKQVKVILC